VQPALVDVLKQGVGLAVGLRATLVPCHPVMMVSRPCCLRIASRRIVSNSGRWRQASSLA
jgi:hypothetical protein